MPADKQNKRPGQPTKYNAKTTPHQAKKLCELGATDPDLADHFEVSLRSIVNWKSEHPEFLRALKKGKAEADCRVVAALFNRAVGYKRIKEKEIRYKLPKGGEGVKVVQLAEEVPPDVTACIFWLKNRCPEQWRDKDTGDANTANEIPQPERPPQEDLELFAEYAQKAKQNYLDSEGRIPGEEPAAADSAAKPKLTRRRMN